MTPRKRPPPGQLGFTFDPPAPVADDAALAGFDRFIARSVARALKEDVRQRSAIAVAMTALLDEEISKFMLDAYASEARDNHNISADRFLALIAVTQRFDLLDVALRRIGAALLVGEEIITAELGNIDRQIAALKSRRRSIEDRAPVFSRGS
jgi:hypothetical protein